MENCPKLSFNYHPIPFLSVPLSSPSKLTQLAYNTINMCAISTPCMLSCVIQHCGECWVNFIFEPGHEKTCLLSYANNKGADQPALPRSLISAFVVRCLDSLMSLDSVTKISSFMLASVAEQASLSLIWSETPEDMFSHDKAHLNLGIQLTLCILHITGSNLSKLWPL